MAQTNEHNKQELNEHLFFPHLFCMLNAQLLYLAGRNLFRSRIWSAYEHQVSDFLSSTAVCFDLAPYFQSHRTGQFLKHEFKPKMSKTHVFLFQTPIL
jgi:hypothetical protein